MGLCKCPKRQVTNQFCFEHRVNVCEHCMVINHPKCIVQSYLQWLKDSDYDSSCALCQTRLEDGDCVRLSCYHVFHWECLNGRALAMPAHTAPSGHTCPQCSDPVFPPGNLMSPVADVLRSRLAQVNWGRSELGLPLLAGEATAPVAAVSPSQSNVRRQASDAASSAGSSMSASYASSIGSKTASNIGHKTVADGATSGVVNSPVVLNMEAYGGLDSANRRPARAQPIGAADDNDDNKYSKRSPAETFRRWTRRLNSPSSRPPWRRSWFVVFAGLVVFFVFIYLMALFGRRAPSYDDASGSADDQIQSHM